MPNRTTSDDGLVGRLLVVLPDSAWLPEGYTLQPSQAPGQPPAVPFEVTDPAGQRRWIYPIPGFRPPRQRSTSLLATIGRELGPFRSDGFWTPNARRWLGMERGDLVGAVDRLVYGVPDAIVNLMDLANYGLQATIVGGTMALQKTGLISESDAGELRRDINTGLMALGPEAGMVSDAGLLSRAETANFRLAYVARSVSQSVGRIPFIPNPWRGAAGGEIVGVLEEIKLGPPPAKAAQRADFFRRVAAGRAFDAQRARFYDFNQIYINKPSGKPGYWVMDSYLPRQNGVFEPGPVSRKATQLADIDPRTAIAYLKEAKAKYPPGAIFAKVDSTDEVLAGRPASGQLFLEVPVQSRPIPQEILAAARSLSITIRDVTGRKY